MSLLEVYQDPLRATRNPATLAKRAGVSVAAARAFLRDREEAQVRRRAAKPREDLYVPTGDERGVYLCDTIYLNDYASVNSGRSAILTLLEVNSRYAYARGLTRPTSAQTAKALEEILEENKQDLAHSLVAPILKVRSDGGPEFAGEFAALLNTRVIPHERTGAGTHERMARLDRFHGTLRRMIGELFAVRGSNVWFDVLPLVIQNYNSRPNRGLAAAGKNLTPHDIGPEEEQKLREDDAVRAEAVRRAVDESGVGPGSQVRLLYARTKEGAKDKFAKSHEAVWTTEIYSVIKRVGPNSFLVDVPAGEVPVWPLHSLQVVKKALRRATEEKGPVIDKKVVRAVRAERRNISEDEAKAALAAAPLREPRRPRVDYRALAGLKPA